jgi:hypothetical protein
MSVLRFALLIRLERVGTLRSSITNASMMGTRWRCMTPVITFLPAKPWGMSISMLRRITDHSRS